MSLATVGNMSTVAASCVKEEVERGGISEGREEGREERKEERKKNEREKRREEKRQEGLGISEKR